MVQTCPTCSRTNPAEGLFCYYDGSALRDSGRGGALDLATQAFPMPFVFPSGLVCRTFDQLALGCLDNWATAIGLLQQGDLASFFGGLGRADLAQAARAAASFPDRDRGLDQFLAKLPTQAVKPPQLQVEPSQVNLGLLRVGENPTFDLHLVNQGMRLLYGSISCPDSVWLSLGDNPGAGDKLFQCTSDTVIKVHVRGQQLRAGNKPLEGRLVIDSNGGVATVFVRCEVPVKPFAGGVLTGAITPRQIAEKAKAAAKDAAVLFEKGAVAKWYQENGWTYPVQGPSASGLGAVQQFFEALGLTAPPKVDISERHVNFQGNPGQELKHTIEVKAEERRPVYAHAVSDQPWLEVSRVQLGGRTASIRLAVPSVPNRPGEVLHARLTVTANGNQRFVVPVMLAVGGRARVGQSGPIPIVVPGGNSRIPTAVVSPMPLPDAPLPVAIPLGSAPPPKQRTVVRPPPAGAPPSEEEHRSWPGWIHLLPPLLLAAGLLVVMVRDMLYKGGALPGPVAQEEELIDPAPRIEVRFHDQSDADLPNPSMRFGLVMLKEHDPRDFTKFKRLTYDERGRTNNTCLRIDDEERLFGDNSKLKDPRTFGRWESMAANLGKEPKTGRELQGMKSIWGYDDLHVVVTQTVEIIPGEQSRLLDTCLVRYLIENRAGTAHRIGLRFMLDTYIGANDGVPFTIPGEPGLCDTMKQFLGQEHIPDFIQALESENLEKPGTIAHVRLKLGGKVPTPDLVTLGAWPDGELKDKHEAESAMAQLTGWDVPVLPMKRLHDIDPKAAPDSAVTIYWNPQEVPPNGSRELAFMYGLGNVFGGEGKGKLAVTVGGSFKPGGEFTVTAYVSEPVKGQTVTLTLPGGFELIEGRAEQPVPELPEGAASKNSPVTWKVRAINQEGKYTLKVQSSTGISQSQPIIIRSGRIFD